MEKKMKKILIIDDDPIIQKYLKSLFEDNGYATLVAENSQEALDLVSSESCDLITLDLDSNGLIANLSCAGNEITSLDLSAQTNLVALNSSSNKLISLIISNGNNASLSTLALRPVAANTY